jgi:uncharacterized protein
VPGNSSDPDELKSVTRVVLRPLGSALPLGFFAFGVGVILLTAIELHWISQADAHNVPFVLLGFVAPLELLASIIAFLSRDTAAATTLGVFALSWVPQAIVMLHQDGAASTTVGAFLVMIALMLAALAIVAYAAKPLLSFILALALLRNVCAAFVQFGVSRLSTTAAIMGIVLTAFSIYGGAAFLIEDTKQTDVLPLFRRGAADKAMRGNLRDQIASIPNKPGVRRQL